MRGPVAIYGEVHLYKPRGIFGFQKVSCVWKGAEYPAPKDVMSEEWNRIMDKAMKEAEKEACRLDRLDPKAKGL